jgi:hypothetical protein
MPFPLVRDSLTLTAQEVMPRLASVPQQGVCELPP